MNLFSISLFLCLIVDMFAFLHTIFWFLPLAILACFKVIHILLMDLVANFIVKFAKYLLV